MKPYIVECEYEQTFRGYAQSVVPLPIGSVWFWFLAIFRGRTSGMEAALRWKPYAARRNEWLTGVMARQRWADEGIASTTLSARPYLFRGKKFIISGCKLTSID